MSIERERLLAKVFVDFNGCWLWEGGRDNHGYGQLSYKNKMIKAHRFSFLAFNGEIPSGLHVLHKCDRPLCVNPKHLFLGTNQDNIKDALDKGRKSLKGERNPKARLTVEDVCYIQASSEDFSTLSRLFNVTTPHIKDIKEKRRWGHI